MAPQRSIAVRQGCDSPKLVAGQLVTATRTGDGRPCVPRNGSAVRPCMDATELRMTPPYGEDYERMEGLSFRIDDAGNDTEAGPLTEDIKVPDGKGDVRQRHVRR